MRRTRFIGRETRIERDFGILAGHTIVEERPYELIVLANVLRILKAPEIAEAGLGVLCFHPSMLPRHRGGDAVYWTFKMGDTESGITWFWVDEGIDTGPTILQRPVPVPVWTAGVGLKSQVVGSVRPGATVLPRQSTISVVLCRI